MLDLSVLQSDVLKLMNDVMADYTIEILMDDVVMG